jgi:hypothetical protein
MDKKGSPPFENYKVYGPYLSKKENRRVMVLISDEGKRTSISYARYLYSLDIGELVDSKYEVDHIDNNSLNDVLDNFQLLTKAENIKKDHKAKDMVTLICPVCGKYFERRVGLTHLINSRKSKGQTTCSRKCGGIKSHWD